MEKLTSRKLWVSVGGVIVVLVANAGGLPWYAQATIAALGIVYVVSEALVDVAREVAPALLVLAGAIKELNTKE